MLIIYWRESKTEILFEAKDDTITGITYAHWLVELDLARTQEDANRIMALINGTRTSECQRLREKILPKISELREVWDDNQMEKRGLFEMAAGLVGTGAGLWAAYKVHQLWDEEERLKNNITGIIHQNQLQIQKDEGDVKRLQELWAEEAKRLDMVEHEMACYRMHQRASKVMRGINSLLHGQLDINIFGPEEVRREWKMLMKKVRQAGRSMGEWNAIQIMQLPKSTVFKNSRMRLVIHVPTFREGSQMKAHEWKKAPVVAKGSWLLTPIVDHTVILMDERETQYVTLTREEWDECKQFLGVRWCKGRESRRADWTAECVAGLWRAHKQTMEKRCQMKRRPLQLEIHEMKPGDVMVASKKEETIEGCDGRMTIHKGLQRLIMTPGCVVRMEDWTLIAPSDRSETTIKGKQVGELWEEEDPVWDYERWKGVGEGPSDASIVNRREVEKVSGRMNLGLVIVLTVITILVSVYVATLCRAWLLVIKEETELGPSGTKQPEFMSSESESESEERNKKREEVCGPA